MPVGLDCCHRSTRKGPELRDRLESWLDNAVRTQVDAFYNHYENFQVIIEESDASGVRHRAQHPNPTKIYGFEAQVEAAFGGFSPDAGLGMDSQPAGGQFFAVDPESGRRSVRAIRVPDPASVSCIDLEGRDQTYAPELTFNASVCNTRSEWATATC